MWAIIAIPFVDNTKVMKNFPETKKKKNSDETVGVTRKTHWGYRGNSEGPLDPPLEEHERRNFCWPG